MAILALCRELEALYVDTVIEPWPGYDDPAAPLAARTNHALRQTLLAERAAHPGGSTAVEADEVDFRRCLEVQHPYLGPEEGHFTDWTPLSSRSPLFPDDVDQSDPCQFRNVLVH